MHVRDLEIVAVSFRNACVMSRACMPMWCRFRLEFGLGHQRGHGINDDDVERVRARERSQSQRFLAAVGLRDQQVVEIHAELLRIAGIQRVFGVNEGRQAAGLLRIGDDVEHERGFAGGFRAENFDDPPAGKTATPSAGRTKSTPVEITEMGTIASFDPNRMIEPLPNCFSICANANSIALPRSSAMGVWLL